MNNLNLDDHPIFKKIKAKSNGLSEDGMNFRYDKNKPIGKNETFHRLGVYVNKIIADTNLPLRRRDLGGSYTWQASDNRHGGNTLLKLCHYEVDDYFFGIRENWAQLNDFWDKAIKLCSYRFAVPPKKNINFIGFPCLEPNDLDKIKDIIELIPSNPKFRIN